jgi:hypothetical protein
MTTPGRQEEIARLRRAHDACVSEFIEANNREAKRRRAGEANRDRGPNNGFRSLVDHQQPTLRMGAWRGAVQ